MRKTRRHRIKGEYIIKSPVGACPECGTPVFAEMLVKEISIRRFAPR